MNSQVKTIQFIELYDDEIVRLTGIVRKLMDESNTKVIGFKYQQSITLTLKEKEFLDELQKKIHIIE